MAEIEIQRKRGSPLPWLIGALALVLVIWAVVQVAGPDEEAGEATPATIPFDTVGASEAMSDGTAAALPAEVMTFRERCATGVQDAMGVEHEREAECLRSLAAALEAVVDRERVRDVPLDEQIDELRARAETITDDAQSTDHAMNVHAVMRDIAQVMVRVAESRDDATDGLRLEAERVQEAANAVSPGQLLLEQKEATAEYFRQADRALELLAQRQRT